MFSFYERFYCQAKKLVIQLEKVKMKYPMFSFEREFRNTVTYHSRLLRAVKQIIGRGCSAKHCEQIYKVNRSWDMVLNNFFRAYKTGWILFTLTRQKWFSNIVMAYRPSWAKETFGACWPYRCHQAVQRKLKKGLKTLKMHF